ncbi:hypothetical protein, unknown function [Leishmania braziliensis MHOM/BR/75/M2904]|uniref:Uncharacterized protein n=2 Tax=Leishmania braziliensis TaxID=5660 RepID=A4H6G2_LEIBR|nr:hypothetical protein, unknown function [Leishmania braziliensis MHOM/BR/75/M2904]KAI5690874.1 hypothetical protein MNV84_01503 [Leishmania braziliensis]CAJ2468224.1 unnamed protein product [Leishmania braziliensis]CAM41914.1 hypothetical protein, unknown function [Leishmania braziliensis MHOM/BR/75/M2904]SYZ63598.1 hypothetical_protein [Leishmania braziliensis MHOM/BR/75/M2904]
MRRPAFPAHRDAQHRGCSAPSSTSSNNGVRPSPGAAAAASLNVWAHACLLDSTAQILVAQPADPLRVLSVRFSTEAILAATYPTTPVPGGEKELEVEAVKGASRVIGAPSVSVAAKPTAFNSDSANPKLSIATTSPTASVPTVEHLIEQNWVRRYLQPYGLHAVARCTCTCPPLRLPTAAPSHFSVNTPSVRAAKGLDNATAGTVCATSPPLLSQWMDMFALLHRQSRMSCVELAAEAKRWNAQSSSAGVMPPVDYCAVEEIPTSVVLLCVMAVIEEHLRRTECGGKTSGAAKPPRLCRCLQISVKLLALQLLAAFMDLQHKAENTPYSSNSSSASSFDPGQEQEVEGDNHDDWNTTAGGTDVCHITRGVYLLSTHQLDELHQWLHCCLRTMILSPSSARTADTTAVDRSNACSGGSSAAVDDGSPLEALQSRTTAYLIRILGNPTRGMAAPASMMAMMSLGTFVAFMERLAAVVVAHQQTAMAMAIALSARLPPTAMASAEEAQLPAWVMEHVIKVADAVVQQQTVLQNGAISDPISSTVPLAWRVYANQLSELLAPFQRDVLAHRSREEQEEENHRGTLNEGILGKLKRCLLSWVKEAEYRHAKAQKRLTAEVFSPRAAAAEVVSAWVSHVFEAYAVTLYPNGETPTLSNRQPHTQVAAGQ